MKRGRVVLITTKWFFKLFSSLHLFFITPGMRLSAMETVMKPPVNNLFEKTLYVQKRNKRTIWTREMHERFVYCMQILGESAAPSKILGLLNIKGLTRVQVASHYQKYKKSLASKLSPLASDSDDYDTESKMISDHQTTDFKMFAKSSPSCFCVNWQMEDDSRIKNCKVEFSLLSTRCGTKSSYPLPLSGFCSSV